ncbi:MAG: D-glycerate dehydrogenase [Elusimicrobiota bacterium]
MSKIKILVTRRVPRECLDLLEPHFDIDHFNRDVAMERKTLLKRVKDKEGVLCMLTDAVNGELLAAAPKLTAVSTYSVGYDHIDVSACAARGVLVTNTPGVLTESTADFTWALLLAAARRVVEGDGHMRGGKYKGWDPLLLLGTDVFGKTLGVVGFGRIGQAVSKRASGFSMRVLYHDPRRAAPEVEEALNARYVSLDELLRESDFVSIHTVLDSATHHLIGTRAFGLMKPSATIINAARGPIVDEKALVKALKTRKIRGAGLDVYEWEPRMASGLASCRRAVLAPHLASASLETRTKMGVMAAQGLIDGLIRRVRSPYRVDS